MGHHVINLKWKEVHRLRIVVEQLVCLFTLRQVQVVSDFGVTWPLMAICIVKGAVLKMLCTVLGRLYRVI